MTNCRICKSNTLLKLIDLGMQPICNRFLKIREEQDKKYPLIIGLCQYCGVVQLINPFPHHELQPIYDWITYKEPEEHLDTVADILSKLLSSKKDSKICGLSFKDDSLLERLSKHGFSNIMRLDIQKDLGADISYGGIETIQSLLTTKQAKKIVERYGTFNLIIARHILEHAYDIHEFMKSIKELLKPIGYTLFEVPDYTKPFEFFDYSTLWEEHIVYFTSETFKNCLAFGHFSLERFEIFSYPIENSIVALVQPSQETKVTLLSKDILKQEKSLALSFSNEFSNRKERVRSFFSKYTKNHGKVAIFGAGHTACLLINIFELGEYIDCVIDDDARKQGLFMPGSHLPIFGSSALLERNTKLCVFVVNPNIEDKIIAKNNAYLQKGGMFLSFCPLSSHSIFSRFEHGENSEQLNFRKVDKQVYYAENSIVKLGKRDIQFLKNKLKEENLQRIRICAHKNIDDAIHEMFIVLKMDGYIMPHKHLNKSESFHLIEGSANIVIFDDNGNIQEIIKMGNYESGQKIYYRMDFPYFHTVIVTSDFLVFHETVQGPFTKTDTVFAPWAPDENDVDAGKVYMQQLRNSIEKFKK